MPIEYEDALERIYHTLCHVYLLDFTDDTCQFYSNLVNYWWFKGDFKYDYF